MDDVTRSEILELVAYGYRNRNGLSVEVAAACAERLVQTYDRGKVTVRHVGPVKPIDDSSPLAGTIFAKP